MLYKELCLTRTKLGHNIAFRVERKWGLVRLHQVIVLYNEFMRKTLIPILLSLLFSCGFPPGSSETIETNETIEAELSTQAIDVSVTALKYYSVYDANGIAGDQDYLGKTLLIKGRVRGLKKDRDGLLVLMLVGDGRTKWQDVKCYFANRWAGELAKLKEGMEVTVKGRGTGYPPATLGPQVGGCSLQ